MVRFPALVALTLPIAFAQTNRYNYDESKIPAYTILDPLTLADGAKVKDAKTWNQTRRPELMALFEDQVYGKTPSQEIPLRTSKPLIDPKALSGKAIRKQVTLYFTTATTARSFTCHLPAREDLPRPCLSSSASISTGTTPVRTTPAFSQRRLAQRPRRFR